MPIPEVNRLANAFCAGAKEVNEAVKCKFAFIGSFFDPPKAKEAAIAQIEAGVDVIYAERFGVIEAAAERGIPAIGNMSDQSELAPDTVVTSVVWDMWPTVKQVISLVQAGVFTSQDFGQFSFMGKEAHISRPITPGRPSCRTSQDHGRRAHEGDHGRQLPRAGRRGHAAIGIARSGIPGAQSTRSRPPGRRPFRLDVDGIRTAARVARHRQALRSVHANRSVDLVVHAARCWGCSARTAPARPR